MAEHDDVQIDGITIDMSADVSLDKLLMQLMLVLQVRVTQLQAQKMVI